MTNRPCKNSLVLSATALAIFTSAALLPVAGQAEERKPNIVLVLMDNLGYGELGAYGGRHSARGADTAH